MKSNLKNDCLKRLIINKYGSEAKCAKALGWPRQRLNKITLGNKEPDVEEINALANILDVSIAEIVKIFLKSKSPNGQQTA